MEVDASLVSIFQLQAEAHNLGQREAKLRQAQEDAVEKAILEANSKLEQILLKFQESAKQSSNEESSFSMRDAQAAIAIITEEYAPIPVEINVSTFSNELGALGKKGDVGVLSVGDQVMIRRLGKLPATIVELPQAEGDYLTVQLGTMKMQVKASEILSRGPSMVTGSSKTSPGKQVKVNVFLHILCFYQVIIDVLYPSNPYFSDEASGYHIEMEDILLSPVQDLQCLHAYIFLVSSMLAYFVYFGSDNTSNTAIETNQIESA